MTVQSGNAYSVAKGLATVDAIVLQMIKTVGQQIGLKNAVGNQIERIAKDYFGAKVFRGPNESDIAFKARIVALIFSPAGTYPGMTAVLTLIIGTPVVIIDAQSSGRLAGAYSCRNKPGVFPSFYYNVSGIYYAPGRLKPHQALINVQQLEPVDPKFLTRTQIMALINTVKIIGTIMWVKVHGPVSTGGVPIG